MILQIHNKPACRTGRHASGHFFIQGSFALPAVLELYDITGRRVYEQRVTSNKQQINVGNLSAGLYIYYLLSDGKAGRGKIIIEQPNNY